MHLDRRCGKDTSRQVVTPRQLVHEMAEQQRDFLLALAQRGHVYGECAQPVVKIFAQFPVGDGLFDVGSA